MRAARVGLLACVACSLVAVCGCAGRVANPAAADIAQPLATRPAVPVAAEGTQSIPGLEFYAVSALLKGTRTAIDNWQQRSEPRGVGPTIPSSAQPLPLAEHITQVLRTSSVGPDGKPTILLSAVELKLDAAGTRMFADFTAAHLDQAVAIALDARVIGAPVIQEPIRSGNVEISADPASIAKLLASVQTSK